MSALTLTFHLVCMGQHKARIVLLVDLRGEIIRLRVGGRGGGGGGESSEIIYLFFFFNIFKTNSKTSKVNQQSVLNL